VAERKSTFSGDISHANVIVNVRHHELFCAAHLPRRQPVSRVTLPAKRVSQLPRQMLV
jgi:hypothetical protein